MSEESHAITVEFQSPLSEQYFQEVFPFAMQTAFNGIALYNELEKDPIRRSPKRPVPGNGRAHIQIVEQRVWYLEPSGESHWLAYRERLLFPAYQSYREPGHVTHVTIEGERVNFQETVDFLEDIGRGEINLDDLKEH